MPPERITQEGTRTPLQDTYGQGGGKDVNFDRVYEVYRWWADEAGGDPRRLREHPHMMGDNEWQLLDQIVQQHGTNFQPARDYRAAQKSGASQEELQQWAPSTVGLGGGWGGTAKDNVQAGHAGTPGGGVAPASYGGGGQFSVKGAIGDYPAIQSRFAEFADTGGYSPQDLANIRARSVSPIRSIYSSARRDIGRQRALQGGYSPNATAALSRLAREQGQVAADASTNVESAIAQMKNQGQQFGASGMAGLYGTTPGMSGLLSQAVGQSAQRQQQRESGPTGWDKWAPRIAQFGGALAPLAMLSDKNAKENIKPADKVLPKLKGLDISTWNYKGDKTPHIGPMAQDFAKQFGGDGKTINLVDVAGVTLGALKEIAEGK